MDSKKYLIEIREKISQSFKQFGGKGSRYAVPNIWVTSKQSDRNLKSIKLNPPTFYLNALNEIISQKQTKLQKEDADVWSRNAVIYNMFVRTTCAFDHNGNGKIDLPVNAEGWRETGTFLKATSMLLFIKSLGANTIHLLPITSIGSDGNKGTLGSPYAIKNPNNLDEKLAEPNSGLTVEEEFKLFVNAAHHLGLRIVVEFVFRTASKDSDWIKQHPEWFYWIKENIKDRKPHHRNESEYGNPIFNTDELKKILYDVENNHFEELLPPHESYRSMFTDPPKPEAIKLEKGRYIGKLADGTRVRIPGAFADWPPDDSQPPWGDVTYLKMYEHNDFNYIAYNTIRMYDLRLSKSENVNKPLWEKISEIIPNYQHQFGIDGVMIDMGHALPIDLKKEMIKRAREINSGFAFWDENFSVTKKSVIEGYNAVIGYQWSDQHHPNKFKNMLKRFGTEGFDLPFFATPESHNTPRAMTREGEQIYSKYAWALSNFLPAIPFIHSGFELGETFPINTGLDFKIDDLKKYPSETLPLFSEYGYNWFNSNQIVDWIQKVSNIRKKFRSLITDASPQSFYWVDNSNNDLISFLRKNEIEKYQLLILANSNLQKEIYIEQVLEIKKKSIEDLLTGKSIAIEDQKIRLKLNPGQVFLFKI
ncbi:MAG: alpha-amylase [Ignavibacteriales bacterium]|nr:alpha-amylase [Ignavibacteriales bacterium]